MSFKIKFLSLIFCFITFISNSYGQNIFDYEDEDTAINSFYNNKDPLEHINRKIFKFNLKFDQYALNPLAKSYEYVLPKDLRIGIKNFNQNIKKPLSFVNSLFLLEFDNSLKNLISFSLNMTFGLFGFYNISNHIFTEEEQYSFVTLFKEYEIPNGIYIMMPFIGPSTTRDLFGRSFNLVLDPIYLDSNVSNIKKYELISKYSNILDFRSRYDQIVNDVLYKSLDPYVATRNIYFQKQNELN